MLRARQDESAPHEDRERDRQGATYFQDIYRRGRRMRPARAALLSVVVILLLLLAGDAILTVRRLGTTLESLASSMRQGQAAIVDGELKVAENEFMQARDHAEQARNLTRRPSLFVGSLLPLIGNDARVLARLPDVGETIADGGLTAIQAARALGATNKARLARAIYANGRVNFAAIDQGQGHLTDALATFREARTILEGLPAPTLDRLENAVASVRADVNGVLDVLERGDTLLHVLPDMMGRDARRRYLVAFQAPSEARATGGSIGLYGVLETNNGRTALVTVGPWGEIEQRAQHGGRKPGRLELLRAVETSGLPSPINLSPDFHEVAPGLLRVYRRATGASLDGVMAVDPIALGDLTNATGPLRGEGSDALVGPDNAVAVILHDTYIRFAGDPLGQSRFLTSVIQDFWDTLGTGRVDAPALVDAFGKGGRSKHLKIYSRDESEQAALREFGMDGSFSTSGPQVQFVFHNNLARNKVDYFLHREIETTIDIASDNFALVSTKVQLENRAPARLPQGLGWQDDNAGVNEMDLSVLMPELATFQGMRIGGRVARAEIDREVVGASGAAASQGSRSYPVASHKIVIPPGETVTVRFSYRVPEATDLLRGGDFGLTLFPQAMVNPDRYVVTIRPPSRFRVQPTDAGGAEILGGATRFEGVLDEAIRIEVQVLPL